MKRASVIKLAPGAVFAAAIASLLAAGCDRSPPSANAAGAPPAPTASVPAGGHAAPAAPAPAARADARIAHPLLWSVERDGKTTYLLGTMHLGVDAESRLPKLVWDKLDGARAFAMETNLDDPSVASLIKPTESSLHQQLGDAYWKKLEAAVGTGMATMVDHMPPLIPAMALSMRGLPQTQAMDKVLYDRAITEHKKVVFLEPAARQITVLGKWMDVKALKMLLDELPEAEQRTRAMLDAYVAGDEHAILALNDDERADALNHGYTATEYDREMTDVLYGRTASWIPAIEQLHAEGGGFIAVGALHLVGPGSVPDLLAHKGYKVTRLTP